MTQQAIKSETGADKSPKYPGQCRTFGQLLAFPQLECDGYCAFCKMHTRVWKYSDRHYACPHCINDRHDTVLPSVKRRDKLNAQLAAIREGQ